MVVFPGFALSAEEFAAGVILHELGHALCIGNHSDCNGGVHIMQVGAHSVTATLSGMQAAISDDEALLVRLLRVLPQGCDMNQYLLD